MQASLFLRFLLVGLLNTGFSFSLYMLMVWLGMHFAAANLFATLTGIAFSFRTQGTLVFGQPRLAAAAPVRAGLARHFRHQRRHDRAAHGGRA